MARIQIPLDVLTSRLNLGERFSGLRSGSLSGRFSNLRPLSEFFDFKRLSKPADFAEMQSRVNYNLGHFSSNYAVIFVMLCIYALLTNTALLFTIVFVTVGMWVIGKLDGRDLEIGQHRFTTSQLYTGLYVIAIPIGLWSAPWRTVLWLIGASGVVIIGHAALLDKPIDEAFSGEARVVEELDSDEDSDTGVGIDLGDRDGGATRSRRMLEGRDARRRASSDDTESDGEDHTLGAEDKEDALYRSAMARIKRAQEKGKTDVRLSKEELAAYERHRQREEEEEERRRRREQRVAIPLSHLQSGLRTKRNSLEGDSPPQRHSTDLGQAQQPVMGYFPPSASRTLRPPTATGSSSRTPSRSGADRERADSPFTYSYIGASDLPGSARHASDPAVQRPHSRVSARAETVSPPSRSDSAPGPVDPFQFMTGGPKAPYHSGSASRRTAAGVEPYSYPDSPTGDRPRSGRARSGSDSSDEGRASGSGLRDSTRSSDSRGRAQEHLPLPDERPRHEPERRSTRDRSPATATSSGKKSSVAQAPVRLVESIESTE
ncbi:COPII vesicles protein Yip3 [Echria macrotheca]|uniref:COPII vesicles protein Yip3 n=1 Tax=Echria macrotheca TaxID=438768 RepID=A0AAJ0B346_9PEZI|nr:COPII vesicles protein Yip3 [Echria macrotheca]